MVPKQQEPEDDGSTGELLLYVSEDGRTRLDVRMEGGTVWLSQALMAELFQTTPQNITIHLKALFNEGEIREQATCKEYLQVRQEGARFFEARRRGALENAAEDEAIRQLEEAARKLSPPES